AETLLVVKGRGDCLASPGLFNVVCWSAADWLAEFLIWETWNKPPTLLPKQGDQEALVLDIYVDATGPVFGDFGQKIVDVFRAYSLAHSNFFVVPRNASVVFQVGLEVDSGLDGGGWCTSSFLYDMGFLMCPYVALQVAPF